MLEDLLYNNKLGQAVLSHIVAVMYLHHVIEPMMGVACSGSPHNVLHLPSTLWGEPEQATRTQ